MTVERITLTAIRYVDTRGITCHMVPLRDPSDNTWWVLDEDGVNYYADAADVRRFADEWDADPERGADEDESIAAYRALHELLQELRP